MILRYKGLITVSQQWFLIYNECQKLSKELTPASAEIFPLYSVRHIRMRRNFSLKILYKSLAEQTDEFPHEWVR